MHLVNTNFGHLHALARYVGEPDRPIVGYVQHGWYEVGPLDEEPQLPWVPKFVWNDRNAADARGASVPNVVPIGAPRVYLDGGNAPAAAQVPEPRGTIAYPYHSWDYPLAEHPHGNVGVRRDEGYGPYHRRFAAELLEREEGPVTVALYWRDHEEPEAREAYEALGMRVVTHGRRDTADFLVRQRDEQRAHARAVTNRIGSALWYAGYEGLGLEVYGPFTGPDPDEVRWFHEFQVRHFSALFQPGGVDGEEGRALAAEELGARHKREPEELAQLLGWRGVRRRLAPLVELADRVQFRLRQPRHVQRLADRPPPWRTA